MKNLLDFICLVMMYKHRFIQAAASPTSITACAFIYCPLGKRNLPLSEVHHSLSELNQYPITVFQREMAERRGKQIASYIIVEATQGRDSVLLCSEVNFERNSMEVKTEDSLENQENSGVMKENPHATQLNVFMDVRFLSLIFKNQLH